MPPVVIVDDDSPPVRKPKTPAYSASSIVHSGPVQSVKRKAPSSPRASPPKKKVKKEGGSVKPKKPPVKGGRKPDEEASLLDVNPMVRYPLLLLNLALWFLGILLMAVGGVLYVNSLEADEGTDVLSDLDSSTSLIFRVEVVVSIAGVSLFVVSFCGCVGALRENRCLLQLYSLALTAMIAAHLVFGVVIFYVPGERPVEGLRVCLRGASDSHAASLTAARRFYDALASVSSLHLRVHEA
ncbi:hypothetical protein V5799_003047 [Amblyomma americanum]|uniref:Uncharacterized protein n=1 Tax=Amblyomma americanum TaxID=6943 RepID=A0AAQ4DA31_AMBAM